MTPTTVTGTGRRSSVRLPDLQVPATSSASQQMTSPIDKFPPFIDEVPETTTEPRESHSNSIRYAATDRWEPRKQAQFPRDNRHPTLNSKRRSRKSISEAISTIRTRNGSVSANAQELAEALKAPVSYKLIVRLLDFHGLFPTLLLTRVRFSASYGT